MPAADTLGLTVGATDADPDKPPKLKVFVSYSRTDTAFADEVVAGLEYDGGFEVFLDRHSIHEGEAWRERLGGLIAAADIVVFLVSRASAASELCQWEVSHAQSLSKRIVPALIEPVSADAAPASLNALQYVRFDEGHSFMAGLASLRRALRADLHWIREHTRLLTRAQEWDTAGRSENRLLYGPDIAAAKAWLEQRPPDAPPPLELHRDYIAASEQAEAARLSDERSQAQTLKNALSRSRRALALATGAGGLAGVACIAAGYFWYVARDQRNFAEAAIEKRDAYIAELEAAVAEAQEPAASEDEPNMSEGPSTSPPPLSPSNGTASPEDDTTDMTPNAPGNSNAGAPDPALVAELAQLKLTAETRARRIEDEIDLLGERLTDIALPPRPSEEGTVDEQLANWRAYDERLKEIEARVLMMRPLPRQQTIDPEILQKAPEPYMRKKG
ncbi:MAG: toll/interleukin-1 receptor domain-containing protein [Hyphomonadaceae bacterium]